MPEVGTTEPSVLFLVSVAAEAFTFEITIYFLSFIASYFISQATHGFM
jgi:hypothetical protein